MVCIPKRATRNKQAAKKKRRAKTTISLSSNYQYDILPEEVDGQDYFVWFW
tara:strand:+ start:245 stop:397 length:153 start_codon:yes stop_codon:yes gene_type:complete